METEQTIPKLIHDIRSSLGVIQTTAELQSMNEEIPPQMGIALGQIIAEVREIATLLSHISEKLSSKE